MDVHNRAFSIASITSSALAQLAVKRETVSRDKHALNQYSMKLGVSSLEHDFQYAEFASSKDFMEKRQEYLATQLRAPSSSTCRLHVAIPGQSVNGPWVTRWIRVALAGCFSAPIRRTKNELVAAKMMELGSGSKSTVDKEVAACRASTALAGKHDYGG